jgi:hypothetical protein
MVSAINKITEIRLASSAPPAKDTIVTDVVTLKFFNPYNATAHTVADKISCKSATKLVASKTAPNCVLSPNFIVVAIKFTIMVKNNSQELC